MRSSEAGPNGVLTFTLNDKINRREGLLVPGQAAITYAYDNNDNLISVTQGGQTTSFTVDALNRVVRTTRGSSWADFRTIERLLFGIPSEYGNREGDWRVPPRPRLNRDP